MKLKRAMKGMKRPVRKQVMKRAMKSCHPGAAPCIPQSKIKSMWARYLEETEKDNEKYAFNFHEHETIERPQQISAEGLWKNRRMILALGSLGSKLRWKPRQLRDGLLVALKETKRTFMKTGYKENIVGKAIINRVAVIGAHARVLPKRLEIAKKQMPTNKKNLYHDPGG